MNWEFSGSATACLARVGWGEGTLLRPLLAANPKNGWVREGVPPCGVRGESPAREAARAGGAANQPRPSNGMAVALMVIVKTFASSGRLAM